MGKHFGLNVGVSRLKRIFMFGFMLLCLSVFAVDLSTLPVFEDPVLMTVWGSSSGLGTVSFVCDAINLPHDYSPDVTMEEMKSGTGLGGSKDESVELSWLYDSGVQYMTLILVVGTPAGATETDARETSRVFSLINLVKSNNGRVMVVDIDIDAVEGQLYPAKQRLAEMILPGCDLFVLADSPLTSYEEAVEKLNVEYIQLDNLVDLMNLFAGIFGDNRC